MNGPIGWTKKVKKTFLHILDPLLKYIMCHFYPFRAGAFETNPIAQAFHFYPHRITRRCLDLVDSYELGIDLASQGYGI